MELRPIPGLPDYAANELGEIYRLSIKPSKFRPRPETYPRKVKLHTDKVMKYQVVRLWSPEHNGWHTFQAHRLICMAMHGLPPSDDHDCHHKDNNRSNNRAENLCWITRLENLELKAKRSEPIPTDLILFFPS